MEVLIVHWFKGVAWNDLALAAVGCVSVTGVWVTFWPGHRERLRKLRQHQLDQLLKVKRQLGHIGAWAFGKYGDGSHDPQWYDPSWGVIPFEWADVERFNQVVIEGDYRRGLTIALQNLEGAAERFHRMLADQIGYRTGAPDDIGVRWRPVVEAAAAKGAALSDDDLLAISGLTALDRRWLPDLYRRNKAIHVEGIGGPGSGGLHDAWTVANAEVTKTQAGLQTGRDSLWRWAGHFTAGVFAALGLLFLIDFGWSFVEARLHPDAAQIDASPDSTSKPRAQAAPPVAAITAPADTLPAGARGTAPTGPAQSKPRSK